MMALAARFPHLTRLDVLHEAPRQEQVVLKMLKKTFPTPCPQLMPLLESLNYVSHVSRRHVDFFQVIWSRDDEECGLKKMKEWYHFYTPRQLRLFGDAIGQDMRDSIQTIHVQFDDAAMTDELLRFRNLVMIRLLSNGSVALRASTFDTLIDKGDSLIVGLPSLKKIRFQDPSDAAKFLPFNNISTAFMKEKTWTQPNSCASSFEESSREPTPAAWAPS